MSKKKKYNNWSLIACKVLCDREPCVCPSCGSENLKGFKRQVGKDGIGYGIVWCETCRIGRWASRMHVNEDCGEEPPKGIRLI